MLKKNIFMKKPDVWLGLFLPFSILGIIQNYYNKVANGYQNIQPAIELVWKQHCESLHTLLLCNCNIYMYVYAYENFTRKFIHRRFVLYLLKLYRIPCTGCFNLEVFLIPPKKVKRCNIYDITLETAQNKKIVNYR